MAFRSPWDRIAEALPGIGQALAQGILMREEQRLRQEEIDRLERIRQEDIARAERIRQAEIARQERIRQEDIARAAGIREEDIARREQELLNKDKNARIEQLSTSLIGLSDPQLRSQIENEINQIRSASTREELNVALGAVPGRQETTFGMQGGVGPESRVTGTRVVGGERDVSTLLGLAAQSVFDAERRREEQNILDAAAIADAQGRRNSLAASFTQLSETLRNLQREGRGQSTIAVQISDSLAAIEQGMRMPITTGQQARDFNEYSEALFTAQPIRVLPSTVERAAPAMEARRDASGRLIPAAEEPVRTMGVQGALGAPQRPQARSVFPSIGVEEQPIGTPGQLVARGTGVVARAQEREEAATIAAQEEQNYIANLAQSYLAQARKLSGDPNAVTPALRDSLRVLEDAMAPGSTVSRSDVQNAGQAVLAAQRDQMAAEEQEAAEEEAAAALQNRTLSVAESVVNTVSNIQGSSYYNDLPPEIQDRVNLAATQAGEALTDPSTRTPSELLSFLPDLAAAQREGGQIEESRATYNLYGQRILDAWQEGNVTSESALQDLANLKEGDVWDGMSNALRTLLIEEATERYGFDATAATAQDAALASQAVNANMPLMLEGQDDNVWRMAGQALGLTNELGEPIDVMDLSGEELRSAVSNRMIENVARANELENMRLEAQRMSFREGEMRVAANAEDALIKYAQMGRIDQIDFLERVANGEETTSNVFWNSIAEQFKDNPGMFEYAREVATEAREDLLRADREEDLRDLVLGLETTDRIVTFLAGYDEEQIYDILDTRPLVAAELNSADVERAINLSQQRQTREAIEQKAAESGSTAVESAWAVVTAGNENPQLIGERIGATPGGFLAGEGTFTPPRRGVDTAPITLSTISEQLDVLVEANQITQEHADVLYGTIVEQKLAADDAARQALAQAEFNDTLRAAGIIPEWDLADYRTQVLNFESAAEATLNKALNTSGDAGPCATRDSLSNGIIWGEGATCQGIRQDYVDLQNEINKYSLLAANSEAVQNIPTDVDLRGFNYLGIEALSEIARMNANNATVEEMNARANELRDQYMAQFTPRDVSVEPEVTIRAEPTGGTGAPESGLLGEPALFDYARANQRVQTSEGRDLQEAQRARARAMSALRDKGYSPQQVSDAAAQLGSQYGTDIPVVPPGVTPRQEPSVFGALQNPELQPLIERVASLSERDNRREYREALVALRRAMGVEGFDLPRQVVEQYRRSGSGSATPFASRPGGPTQGTVLFRPSGTQSPNGTETGGRDPAIAAMAAGSGFAESRSGDYGAIGYDDTGGWSYGKTQFASNVGGLENFFSYLETNYPSLAQTLEDAGGLEAAKRGDEQFQQTWRSLSQNLDFREAQDRAAEELYFRPALNVLERGEVNTRQLPEPVLGALGETANNFGPSFERFIKSVFSDLSVLNTMPAEEIINALYDARLAENEDGTLRLYGSLPVQSDTETSQEDVRRNLNRVRNELLGRL